MTKLLSHGLCNCAAQIRCSYVNATSQIQIARITNLPHWYFERTVLPGQHLLFEALLEAQLEIHTSMMITAILLDKIPCEHLRIKEKLASPLRLPMNRRWKE